MKQEAPTSISRSSSPCNKSIEELYHDIEIIDKLLEDEYKDGETDYAAQLEVKREDIENIICLLEEETLSIEEDMNYE